jgi:hypothetical protein
MKKRIALSVAVSLFLIFGLAAAGEENGAEQIVVLQEFAVHPEGMVGFEAVLMALQGPAAEHGMKYGWDVYSADDLRYTLAYRVEGLAGVEAMFADWNALGKRWGEENASEWYEKFFATFDSFKMSLWHPRMDLSHLPENMPKENDFFYWGTLTVKPGHMEAVEQAFKKFAQIMTEHEVPSGWQTAIGGIGTEGPVLAYLEWGASAGAFFTRVDEIESNEELMKASEPIWMEMLPHIRGFEYVTGKYRKDLSWHPEKKAAQE